MHIPDGFLDAKTALASAALSLVGLGFALHHTRQTLPPRKIPLLGLAAAFVFAAQMINFPVGVGTSGHLLGGVLVAALLGPSAAVIVISTVLIVQCLAFADGGITALGANIFNMAILGGAVGGLLYQLLARFSKTLFGRLVAAILAAWFVVVLASIAAAGELALSGKVAWNLAFPVMTGVHALIGLGEGLITALVLSAIAQVRPELVCGADALVGPSTPGKTLRPLLVFGILAATGLALFVSPFASKLPDGLNFVAQKLGFEHQEQTHPSLLQNYTPLAAAIATLLIFPLAWLIARLLLPRKQVQPATPPLDAKQP